MGDLSRLDPHLTQCLRQERQFCEVSRLRRDRGDPYRSKSGLLTAGRLHSMRPSSRRHPTSDTLFKVENPDAEVAPVAPDAVASG
jgi:hypothetical protein